VPAVPSAEPIATLFIERVIHCPNPDAGLHEIARARQLNQAIGPNAGGFFLAPDF
tara:strand:+ start:102 stop:266 length:165 start_codon:yes stop_codon:yes gene_type:complete